MSIMLTVYDRLLSYFGTQGWWPAETSFEMMVGAVLTQRTNWRNAARAIENLKRARLVKPADIASAEVAELAALVRCAGFFKQKAERLTWIARIIVNRYEGSVERVFKGASTDEIREELLSWKGVGLETADVVLLYAANRLVFPIDIYTRRLVERLGLGSGGYDELQRLFVAQLPRDLQLYKEFHALIDELGKKHCRAKPRCADCPLGDICETRIKASRVDTNMETKEELSDNVNRL